MSIVRFPVINTTDPEYFGGGVIQEGAHNVNVLYGLYPNQRPYATQRPSISLRDTVDPEVIQPKARGITYWDAVDAIYFVVDDTIYLGGYANPLVSKISPGRQPVYFFEMGDYLILLDPENNEGWYFINSDPDTFTKISDGDFPGNQANRFISHGGAVLDGFLFVMDTTGLIWNSNINDPTAWTAIDFIGTEREEDTGVFLTKHHDNLVAMGAKSIEFFYNSGNPTGSPLQRRSDVAYRTGPISGMGCVNTGERIYFVGSEVTGTVGYYEIAGFRLSKVSDDSIDSFLNNTRARAKFDFNVTGGFVNNHLLTYITTLDPYEVSGVFLPKQTIVYDATNKHWPSFFETEIGSIEAFGLVQITERSDTDNREGRMLFFSGDIGVFDITEDALDTSGNDVYVAPNYIVSQDDYILDLGQEDATPVYMELILCDNDFDMLTNKFMHRMSVIGTTIADGESNTPIYVSWSDDHYRTFSAERPLDTGLNRSLTRLGSFRRRAFKLTYFGVDTLRIEQLEMDVRASRYA